MTLLYSMKNKKEYEKILKKLKEVNKLIREKLDED